jgi:hypothetical protein
MRFKLNEAGVKEILTGPAVLANLMGRARRVAAAAGPGHRVESGRTSQRVYVDIVPDTPQAWRNERDRRSLTRAIDAARG